MRSLRFSALAATLGVAAVLQAGTAHAFTVYTDRAAWQAALGSAIITTDTFDNVKPNAQTITFDSGVVSTGNGIGLETNEVAGSGNYQGGIEGEESERLNTFDTITWSFPEAIIGFGADWRTTTTGDRLTVTGNFDGTGDQTVRFFTTLGEPGDGFVGIVGLAPFSSITFGTENVLFGVLEIFEADNLSFAAAPPAATPIPTPALLPGLVGMGIAAWRKRRSEATEEV